MNNNDINQIKNIEHIYIHWPFCRNKCHYCDFISFEKHEGFEEKYHKALCNQIKIWLKNYSLKNKNSIKTIFLGGGSPGLYPLSLLKKLFIVIRKNFDLSNLNEVTIEANPQDITEKKLKVWKELGINRLSIGVQILDDKILQNLNRIQKNEDIFNVVKIIPNYFENISVDLILGLPGVTKEIWKRTLKTVTSWPITHISIYLLTVYEKTPLFFKVKNKKIKLLKEGEIIDLYEDTIRFLEKKDIKQYEISNFARKGFQSIHNKAYWDRRPYVGFGLGAASFDGSSRYINEKNLDKFLKNYNERKFSDCIFDEKLNKEQIFLETLMLGLRQKKGIDLQRMLYFLRDEKKDKFLDVLKLLKSTSLIQKRGGRISLTLRGMFLENEVILNLSKCI